MQNSSGYMNQFIRSLLPGFFVPNLTVCVLCASALLTVGRGAEAEKQEYLNGGYFLLHQLCDNEAQLPLLLDLKHSSPEIKTFADRISRTAKESNTSLEQMQDTDPAIKFDRNPLPSIEQDVRESIQDEKQHQLLFGTSGAAFERALLVSQVEASNYARNIAKVLAENENDPKKRISLEKISSKWFLINKETFRLLSTIQ
jgi:hypothetical protein